jgi:DNA polymerase-4
LHGPVDCDPPDLVDSGAGKRAKAEHAMDEVRAKFGSAAVGKGRQLQTGARAVRKGQTH